LSLAQNLRRRSDFVLDQPLADKIHAPPTHPFEPWFFRHPSFRFTRKHPLFADVFLSSVNAGPSNCWLPSCYLGPLPSLSSLRFDRVHRQAYDLVSYRIWVDQRFALAHERHYCSPVEEPATFMPPIFPFAYHTNLTSISILRPSPCHASTPNLCKPDATHM